MQRQFVYLSLVLILGLALSVHAQNIILVGEGNDLDGDGNFDDYRLVEVLEAEGYSVDIRRGYWMALDDDKIDALNAADLVIISRNTGSGNYNQAGEPTRWNSVTTPMILPSAWFVRNNRWLWLNSTDTVRYGGAPALEAVDITHPVFVGVPLDANNQAEVLDPNVGYGQTSFIDVDDVGNGWLIASTAGDNYPWIVEWDEGVEFYEGAGQFTGGRRMYLSFGTQENDAKDSPMGAYNFNAEGELIFLNAVYYMLTGKSRLAAHVPNPATGEIDVPRDALLSWKPGVFAETHNVYFGTSFEDVNEAAIDDPREVIVSQEQTETTYDPGIILDYGQTYYWRVDEVNAAPDSGINKGEVWNFTVSNFIVIDDFEDYNDYEPDTVYLAWLDGYGDPTNGSTSGYAEPIFSEGEHFVETDNVHSGFQALPYFYDNTAAPKSEVTKTLTSMTNWMQDGVVTLRLWYMAGQEGNAAEPMYVTISGTATITNDDANAALATEWTEWVVSLQDIADQGVDLTNVVSMTIGFGDGLPGGAGMVIFDDIRLYRP